MELGIYLSSYLICHDVTASYETKTVTDTTSWTNLIRFKRRTSVLSTDFVFVRILQYQEKEYRTLYSIVIITLTIITDLTNCQYYIDNYKPLEFSSF